MLIENSIGKAKRILKYYNCPIVPTRSKDALLFLYEIGLIDEEMYKSLIKAIAFRNSKIYDYIDFNVEILSEIVKNRYYLDLYNFLIETPKYSEVLIKRIENFNI